MGKARHVGKYQLGRTIGEGTFAEVKFAHNTENGERVAIKILAKSTIRHKMVDQIKREISIMKIVRHPNIVELHEVLASRTKIYSVLDFISGGSLFDKIVHQGRLSEDECRSFFQQLIDAIAHCRMKGVYHRDLKPENLLLDSHGRLKVSDFGLSSLHRQSDGLLHTTCGTPNYVAPEINDAEFPCPFWFSPGATSLIRKILNPNPKTRIRIDEIGRHPWFRNNYIPVQQLHEIEEVNLDDVQAVFDEIEEEYLAERSESRDDYIVSGTKSDCIKRQTRFVSRKPGKTIMSSIEEVAESVGLKVGTRNFKTRIEGSSTNKAVKFAVFFEVYEVAPSLFMIDVRKAFGETLEYHKFYQNFCSKLDNIIWKPTEGHKSRAAIRTMAC